MIRLRRAVYHETYSDKIFKIAAGFAEPKSYVVEYWFLGWRIWKGPRR